MDRRRRSSTKLADRDTERGREGERSGRRAHVVAGQNICSAAAREWGRGLTSRRTSLCVYLGNNYVNGFSSLPVAACLPACSAHPPSGQSCSLSLFLFYHSFVAQFAGKHDVLFWNLSVWETWRSGRPTDQQVPPPWDGCLWRAMDARAANGCCQHVTRTDGRDAPALSLPLSPYTSVRPPLHYISNYSDHHCGGGGICCSGIGNHRSGPGQSRRAEHGLGQRFMTYEPAAVTLVRYIAVMMMLRWSLPLSRGVWRSALGRSSSSRNRGKAVLLGAVQGKSNDVREDKGASFFM